MKIKEQIHYINPKYAWKKVETVKLKELFSEYKENPKQIIRFNSKIYNNVIIQLLDWELNLFNLTDNVNNELIRKFQQNKKDNNYALITEIYWERWIIKESSLKIAKILEMWNYWLKQIYKQELYKNWINNFENLEKLINWLVKEFYKWNISINKILKIKKLFFRQITL